MLSLPTIAAVAAHPGGPGFGFLWLFVLVPLAIFLVFALVVGIAGRRWRRAGWAGHGYGPGYGHGFGHGGPWSNGAWSPSRGAEASLAERFAQGDIDEEEFRARLEVLRANRFPEAPATPKKSDKA